jgi:predicted Zn-dependent protease
VYVTDSLMSFVKNREELAAVLCHETSHTIHHDVVNNMHKDQNLSMLATGLSLLLGGKPITNEAISMAAGVQALSFSRSVETAADIKGSDTCAEAGYNPWGMIWLFQQYAKSDTGGRMEMLSDHPSDMHRIADLENHFKRNPGTFAKFDQDIASATPLWTPGDAGRTAGPPPAPQE